MNYAFEKTGSNKGLFYNKKVQIQSYASSENELRYTQYMFDNNQNTWFCSNSTPHSYFQINFINIGVKLKEYAVRVGNWENSYPRSWTVTGFNGMSWYNLSTVIESKMNEPNNKVKTYPISYYSKFYYTSIRFESIDECYTSTNNTHHFCMADLEIFGVLGNVINNFIFTAKNNKSMKNTINFAFIAVIITHPR